MIKHASIIRIADTAAFVAAMASAAAPTFAFAHEGHQMECSDSSMNAMKADIQAMPDGKSKTTAINEMQAAQDMMRKKDMKACAAHMHTAMEAMEK